MHRDEAPRALAKRAADGVTYRPDRFCNPLLATNTQSCMVDPNRKHVLCTWEYGGDLGHLTRLANITRKLEQRNYKVTVALKDLSRAATVFAGTGASLLQAPVWLPKITLNRPIACLADSLLLLGYLEPDGLHGLYQGWQALTRFVKPDLVLYDYSPTAMLANQPLNLPSISVGTGFWDPEPGHPIADWRPQPYTDQLIARQEARLLDSINRVRLREQLSPLPQFSELYRGVHAIISTFPALDIYADTRSNALYRPLSVNASPRLAVQFPAGDGPTIIAYLKPQYAHLDLLLKGLSRSKARVFVACPGGQDAQFKPYASARFAYSTGVVELEKGIADADLFLGHGNMGSVVHSLEHGTPLAIIPIHQEQLLTGQRVHKTGAGVLIDRIESVEHLRDQINAALGSAELKQKAQQFQADNLHLLQQDLADTVVELCDRILGSAHSSA